jgi:hypothetical protein
MTPVTPYSSELDGREPIQAMQQTAARIRDLVSTWSVDLFERTYAPGKWSAGKILIHLAQTEIALGSRARLALTLSNFVAQLFEQDDWIRHETALSGQDALQAFVALSRMNAVFFAGLSPEDRQRQFGHPEYGTLTIDWLIHQLAGHQIHHLTQLEAIA